MHQLKKSPLIWLLLFFFLLQLAVGLLVIDGSTLSFDESIWHYIGRNWFRHGLVPYTGGVDNKSPFMFAIYGLSDLLFGINYWFPRLFGTIAQTIGMYFLYQLVHRIAGSRTALFAISIYGLSLAWRATGGKYISYTESYEVCLLLAAFYFFFRDNEKKSFFISGCLAGISIFFRLTGVFGALTILIASIQKGRTNFLRYLFGMVLTISICLSIIALAGISLREVFVYGLWDNLGEGSVSARSFSWKLENLANGLFLSNLLLFLPGIVGYILLKKKMDVFIWWLVLEFIGLNLIGLYARQHFRDLLAPMSIMTAVYICFLLNKYQWNWRGTLVIVWVLFFPKQLEPLYALKNILMPRPQSIKPFCEDTTLKVYDEDKRELGEWLYSNSKEGDKIFIGGMSAVVQVYSTRISPTIYFNATETSLAKKKIVEDLSSHQPDIILIPKFSDYLRVDSAVRSFVDSLVAKDYRYESCQNNYSVYRLKEVTSR